MTPVPHKTRIAHAFGQAKDYAQQAHVQRQTADMLADLIVTASPATDLSILEIGCGTGFLTQALAARLGSARWTITDIAPEMIDRTATTTGLAADYRVMDGEQPDLEDARFDLIVSSLAFQWFADLPGSVARLVGLLRPGGLLAFSTMAAGSFAEWRAAHATEGLMPGTPAYPDEQALQALAPDGCFASVRVLPFVQRHDGARAFLHQVKAIGAAIPVDGRRILSPAKLRRVMAAYDAGPRTATYEVGFCLFRAATIG